MTHSSPFQVFQMTPEIVMRAVYLSLVFRCVGSKVKEYQGR